MIQSNPAVAQVWLDALLLVMRASSIGPVADLAAKSGFQDDLSLLVDTTHLLVWAQGTPGEVVHIGYTYFGRTSAHRESCERRGSPGLGPHLLPSLHLLGGSGLAGEVH